jgi:predicted lipoprotein with Yx(FWY)xxD motif
MPKLELSAAFVALALLAASPALAQDRAPIRVVETAKGAALADPAGMSLYVFDKDASGRSNCAEACAQNWPPLLAKADAMADGAYGLVTREDGSLQWAFNGRPLYRWIKDQKPGDISGDGFLANSWHLAVAKP